jgi:hypothetical protein
VQTHAIAGAAVIEGEARAATAPRVSRAEAAARRRIPRATAGQTLGSAGLDENRESLAFSILLVMYVTMKKI